MTYHEAGNWLLKDVSYGGEKFQLRHVFLNDQGMIVAGISRDGRTRYVLAEKVDPWAEADRGSLPNTNFDS